MSTLLLHHPKFLEHETPEGHPERADRLRAIDRILEHERFQQLERDLAKPAEEEQIVRCHPADYVDLLRRSVPETGLARIDEDTAMSPGSFEAALLGAGAACTAVDEVMSGKITNAFCALRPPGHHAEKASAMGFCFFNNAAIAARHAQAVYGAERVAIMDFDVHHGNGTQDIFWDDPTVFYGSTHQMPLYPGSGALRETGAGNIFNAPLSAGADGKAFQEAMNSRILPAMKNFKPDLVIISAGFDAHARDPLAELRLVEADFAWATYKLMEIADQCCNSRVVSVLEGGYDLEGLARSTAAHVIALMDS
ncbi:histone deacetylase family protein [Amorphus orientalis]|uniref:Acetoin utilization deacetylase AcuC-like enzyme n=1 Tax=Amorphus orientalis TaxID=649198 RepID=A0AAE4ARM7_9HYPH|nr:histone deacetylase family protein [Amorphus orientalis]MDQ0314367.1 acetoin utilization deacetylase AcuC-like enzyme [Amorphus orientalis]